MTICPYIDWPPLKAYLTWPYLHEYYGHIILLLMNCTARRGGVEKNKIESGIWDIWDKILHPRITEASEDGSLPSIWEICLVKLQNIHKCDAKRWLKDAKKCWKSLINLLKFCRPYLSNEHWVSRWMANDPLLTHAHNTRQTSACQASCWKYGMKIWPLHQCGNWKSCNVYHFLVCVSDIAKIQSKAHWIQMS